MKILYAIQGTGNGHLARATEIVPILKLMADTDVLVSGTQADLKVPFRIDYKYKGLSFIFGKNGGVDIPQTICRMSPIQLMRDIHSVPVHQYDLIINDFEPVSAWACFLRNKLCIGLSHQNAVLHPSAPLPKLSDPLGKFILKYYAPATHHYGFNFKPFSPNIFPPVIRHDIRNAESSVRPYYTVYLPAYSDLQIQDVLSCIPDIEWQVFSKHSKTEYTVGNIHFQTVSLTEFTHSFQHCTGLICNAGFEGPAEAIFMGKKLCVIPMKNQYEQYCNAAYLESLGVLTLENLHDSVDILSNWIKNGEPLQISFPDMTFDILEEIFIRHADRKTRLVFQH